MSDSIASKTEENLAKERNQQLEDSLIAKRTRFIWLAVLLILLAGGITFTGFWMIALALFILGLIFLSQYFDANGHLHEVQRRSTRTLVPDFSVLRRPDGETTTKAQASPH